MARTNTKSLPSKERLQELFSYDDTIGRLKPKGTPGVETMSHRGGISIGEERYPMARAVYQWHHGNVRISEFVGICDNVGNHTRIRNLRLNDAIVVSPGTLLKMKQEVAEWHFSGNYTETFYELFAKTPNSKIKAYAEAKRRLESYRKAKSSRP